MKIVLSKKSLISLAVLVATLVLTHTANAQATDVFVTAPISGDTNVDDLGTAVLAYDDAGSTASVNGVAFSGNTTQGGVTVSGMTLFYQAGSQFDNGVNSLSSSYNSILAAGYYTNGGDPGSITLSGLTSGDTYQAQIFVFDDRYEDKTMARTESLTGSTDLPADTALITYSGPTFATDGSYVTATFTANGTSQTFDLSDMGNGNGTQFNAINLRDTTDLTVPEPSVYLMIGLGLVGLVVVRRARGSKLV